MTTHDVNPADGLSASHRFLPLLLLLFVGSGCSALIYEIVWFQLLQFVIGSSAISLGVLLGTYMGGMCLGSIALPRVISPRFHPLRVYAFLELGIGVCGILVFFGMPYVNQMYASMSGPGFTGLLMRGAVCGVCLLPPTLLMGATLPAASRWIEATPSGVSWLGFFYGGNITGAVFGCLLAGFYLLRVHDAAIATYAAAAINGSVALLGFGVAALTPRSNSELGTGNAERTKGRAPHSHFRVPSSSAIYVAIAISGMCALGAEVVWTRILSLLLGATVYTFSIILAVFLVGLGVGSSIGSVMARSAYFSRLMLAVCQLLLAAAVAWTAYMVTESIPYWPVDSTLSQNPWFNFQLDLLRCLWAIFPATVLWGASFPLALAAVASRGQDTGRMVGGVYAANTAGAIVGALGTSLWLIPALGSQTTQQVLIGLSATAALLLFATLLWQVRPATLGLLPSQEISRNEEMRGWLAWLALVIVGVVSLGATVKLAALLAGSVPEVPPKLIAYGRGLPEELYRRKKTDKTVDVVYVGEGMNSWVAVSVTADGTRSFHVSGKIEASTDPGDMRLQRMLGHLPALVHPRPRKVLVVGCGAGVTAGTFVLHPDVERIVICEIEPLIPYKVAQIYFAPENYNVVRDPRVEIVIDDARHHVLTTPEKFDIITSDPIHPWVKGAASLYTKEYFEMVKKRLNPGGVVTQWVPLYESDEETVKSEIATFLEVFPNGTIWKNHLGNGLYDFVLMGQVEATRIDLDALDARLKRADYADVVESLNEVYFPDLDDLLTKYAGRKVELEPWLQEAQINRDRNMRLQYLAGMGVNRHMDTEIYETIVSYYRFPEELFAGSARRKEALRLQMELNSIEPEE